MPRRDPLAAAARQLGLGPIPDIGKGTRRDIKLVLAEIGSAAHKANLSPIDYADVARTLDRMTVASTKRNESGGFGGVFGHAMKGLSVPGAALLTLVQNATSILPGPNVLNTGLLGMSRGQMNTDEQVPWAGALGDYHHDKQGRSGHDRVLDAMNIKNPISRLAATIVLDPTWLVGMGPVKLAKVAAEAGTTVGAIKKVTAVAAAKNGMPPTAAMKLLGQARKGGGPVQVLTERVEKIIDDLAPITKAGKKQKVKLVQAPGNIEGGAFGNLLRNTSAAGGVMRAFAKSRALRSSAPQQLKFAGQGLRWGGKDRLTTAWIPNRFPGLVTTAFNDKSRPFRGRSPLMRARHQLTTASTEQTSHAIIALNTVKKNFGKATGLKGDALEEAGERVGAVAAARNEGRMRDAERLIEEFDSKGLWSPHHDDLLQQYDIHWKLQAGELGMRTGTRPGAFAPQADSKAVMEAQRKAWLKARRGGSKESYQDFAARSSSLHERKFGSTYAHMTQDEVVEHFVRLGLDREWAHEWVRIWDEFAEAGTPRVKKVKRGSGREPSKGSKAVPTARTAAEPTGHMPELNIFTLAAHNERRHMAALLDRQIGTLAREAGLVGKDAEIATLLRTRDASGPLSSSMAGRGLMAFTGVFKLILTTINPSHYIRNAIGDYINRNVNGAVEHIMPGGSAFPGSQVRKMVKGDEEALAKKYDLGDGVWRTGEELMIESSFLGLGRGYVGSDIADMMDIYRGGIHDVWGVRHMRDANIARENAQRLDTYIRHRKAGADPFTAASKTLRVHFDYGDLSDIEKVFLRNIIIFYTWLRRNSMLQVSGVITRPGLYNAADSMEEARTKPEGESPFTAMGMPVGFGEHTFNVTNPMAALNTLPITGQGIRGVLGSANPLLRLPLELGMNQDVRSGYPISRYPGDVRPGMTGDILSKLGVDLPYSSPDGERPGGPSVGSYWNHLSRNIIEIGPMGAAISAALSRSREPGKAGGQWWDWVGRYVGVRKTEHDPAAAARGLEGEAAGRKHDLRMRKRYGRTD